MYQQDGKIYLFQYNPEMYQGRSHYQYEIFSFQQDGSKIMLYSNIVSCDMNIAGEQDRMTEQITTLLAEVNFYRESCIPLVEVGEDYFAKEWYFDEDSYLIQKDDVGKK